MDSKTGGGPESKSGARNNRIEEWKNCSKAISKLR